MRVAREKRAALVMVARSFSCATLVSSARVARGPFRQTNIVFNPNVTATSIDPHNVQANPTNEDIASYNFNSQLRAVNFAKDRDVVASGNARMLLSSSSSASSFLKFGMKFRDKRKGRTRTENTFTATSPTSIKLTSYVETGFDLRPFVDGLYDLTPYTSQSLVEPIPSQFPGTTTRNHARDAEEFDGTERVTAGYALAEIYAGQKLYLMPGVRWPHPLHNRSKQECLRLTSVSPCLRARPFLPLLRCLLQ
ncbi:MAG TPA: hypothetical protein VGF24_36075 [Vicinamibacterales bacterium]|jgi:hypothetical protein